MIAKNLLAVISAALLLPTLSMTAVTALDLAKAGFYDPVDLLRAVQVHTIRDYAVLQDIETTDTSQDVMASSQTAFLNALASRGCICMETDQQGNNCAWTFRTARGRDFIVVRQHRMRGGIYTVFRVTGVTMDEIEKDFSQTEEAETANGNG